MNYLKGINYRGKQISWFLIDFTKSSRKMKIHEIREIEDTYREKAP